jgi:hypothetical protein
MRQLAPLTPTAEQIKDAIQDRSGIGGAWPPACFGSGQWRLARHA